MTTRIRHSAHSLRHNRHNFDRLALTYFNLDRTTRTHATVRTREPSKDVPVSGGDLERRYEDARRDDRLQHVLSTCERRAAQGLAILSRQTTAPFSAAQFMARARRGSVPATPAYTLMQMESVIWNGGNNEYGPPENTDGPSDDDDDADDGWHDEGDGTPKT